MSNASKMLVASDLDGTLIGDDKGLSAFARWVDGRRANVHLAYATGRLFDEVVNLVENSPLPPPDVVIGGVGTEMRRFPSGDPVPEWIEQLRNRWSDNEARRTRERLAGESDVEVQPDSCQTEFKASFYIHEASQSRLQEIRQRLAEAGIEFQLIYSSRRDLDILPPDAHKGTAVAFFASLWGVPEDHVITAGDSGNDKLLLEQGFRAIVVANAHDELKKLNNPNVYHASQPYAAGVVEGLNHWTTKTPTPQPQS